MTSMFNYSNVNTTSPLTTTTTTTTTTTSTAVSNPSVSQTGVTSLSSIFGHKKVTSTTSPPPGQSLSGSNSSSTSNLIQNPLLQNNTDSNLLSSPIQQQLLQQQQQQQNSPIHGGSSPLSSLTQNVNGNSIESASSSSLASGSNLVKANGPDPTDKDVIANDIETDKLLNAIEKSKGFSDTFSTTATRRLRNKGLQFPAFNTKNDRFQVTYSFILD
jgi:hypothetical protein